MARQCTVCAREDLEQINHRLLNGDTVYSVAKDFGIVKSTMGRHAEHFLDQTRRKAERREIRTATGGEIYELSNDMLAQANDVLERAIELTRESKTLDELNTVHAMICRQFKAFDNHPSVQIVLAAVEAKKDELSSEDKRLAQILALSQAV